MSGGCVICCSTVCLFWALLEKAFSWYYATDDAPAHYQTGKQVDDGSSPQTLESRFVPVRMPTLPVASCRLAVQLQNTFIPMLRRHGCRNACRSARRPPRTIEKNLVLRVSLSDPDCHYQHFHQSGVTTW
jgi:hypothetical protein